MAVIAWFRKITVRDIFCQFSGSEEKIHKLRLPFKWLYSTYLVGGVLMVYVSKKQWWYCHSIIIQSCCVMFSELISNVAILSCQCILYLPILVTVMKWYHAKCPMQLWPFSDLLFSLSWGLIIPDVFTRVLYTGCSRDI